MELKFIDIADAPPGPLCALFSAHVAVLEISNTISVSQKRKLGLLSWH